MPHDLNIVLVEPEIPMNTGTIGRLCLATETTLHLIEPMGFEINDSKLKRAGLDYWKFVQVKIYPNLDNFFQKIPPDAPKIFFRLKENVHSLNIPSRKIPICFLEAKPGAYLKVCFNPTKIAPTEYRNTTIGFAPSTVPMP